MGLFNERLMELSDEVLCTTYEELKILHNTGVLPEKSMISNLTKERNDFYHDGYNIGATEMDLLTEIARRWYLTAK